MLEFGLGNFENLIMFELHKTSEDRYMFKCRDSIEKLFKVCSVWLMKNNHVDDYLYASLLEKRSQEPEIKAEDVEDFLINPQLDSEKKQPSTNQPLFVPKPNEKDDKQFIGCKHGRLYDYDQTTQKNNYDYGDIMKGDIYSMATTREKRFLYVSDWKGHLKKVDTRRRIISYDFFQIHECINSQAITYDDQYLFTSDLTTGRLFQWETKGNLVVKKYENIFDLDEGTFEILKLLVTYDNDYLFVTNFTGSLSQIDIKSQSVVKRYGQICEYYIWAMAAFTSNDYLIICDQNGHLLKISIGKQQVAFDFGKVGGEFTQCQAISSDNQTIYLASKQALKLVSATTGTIIKDLGNIHDDPIYSIVFSTDKESLFTASCSGQLKKWQVKGMKMEKCLIVPDDKKLFGMHI